MKKRTFKEWMRDWWRGYTDADILSLAKKMQEGEKLPPGSLIPLTNGEAKALHTGARMALP